ncbi:replication initiator protein [Blackfly microvirus SF02]|uniref:Replication initiator protein n=1 Tax=Blackfly microvirus SF02 TaxID=2576452 RepID=A0A4P8PLM0_9VIRU|nr:replication initiator protein [Blackfly microvirus SF02]
MHEAKMHKSNVFLTMTYDDKNYPWNCSISKRELQLFFKKLRKTGRLIRYFACGEYGPRTKRPHYHALVFNCHFADQRRHAGTDQKPLFISKELNELWGKGFCTIQAVNFTTAQYCAGYITKKITGPKADAHYERIDQYGVVHNVEPEFALMSRRPGIGATWIDKFGKEVYDSDKIIIKGREAPSTRYYDTRLEQLDKLRFDAIRLARRRARARNKADNTHKRLLVKEQIAIAKSKQRRPTL